jgi:hypothetical protein
MPTSDRPGAIRIARRELLVASCAALGALALPVRWVRARDAHALPEATTAALAGSGLVYVSPLLADAKESRCHGEVWFLFDEGDVVIATSTDTWKARALERGRDRARIWVGDFGPADSADGPFRSGPTFEARAQRDGEPATWERLFEAYGAKYPAEWGKWEPRFRKSRADGSRILIRYTPIGD